jgi:hypothetical protein
MFDNQAGNQTGIEGVHDYHCLFHILCTPYYNVIGSDRKKDSLADTPSTLWICMMGHQSALHKWMAPRDTFSVTITTLDFL